MAANIDLVKHIQNILFENNKVTIPGLGTFTKKQQNAQINKEEQTLEPPITKLEFQDSLKLNDGVLVDYVSQAEDLPDYIVEEILTKFVQNTLKQINTGDKVQLGAIGTLYTQEGNSNILLDTKDSINFSFDNFGLTTLELPDIAFEESEIPATSLEDFGAMPEATSPPTNTPQPTERLETADHLRIEERQTPPPVVPAQKNKSVADVLAERAATNEGTAVAATPAAIETTQKRKNSIFWRWIIPLLILLAFVLLLIQLFSGKNNFSNNSTSQVIAQNKSNSAAISPPVASNDGQTNEQTANTAGIAVVDSSQQTTDSLEFQAVTESRADESTMEIETANIDEAASNTEEPTINTTNNISEKATNSPPSTSAPKKTTSTKTKSATSSKPKSTNTVKPKTSSPKPKKTTNPKPKSTSKPKSSYAPPKARPTKESPFNIVHSGPAEYSDRSLKRGYYIIVGAFRSRPSAKKLVDKMKRQGYDARLLTTSNGYYRAGIYTGHDLNKTSKQYKESRRKHHKKAWVLLFE